MKTNRTICETGSRSARWLIPALLATVLLPGTLGCGPQQQANASPAADNFAEDASEPAPLPEKALLTLDRLTPPVDAPRNPDDLPELHDRAAEAVEQAQQRLEEQDNFGAVRLLERAAGIDPDHPTVRRSLGLAYARQQNWAKALENFRKAAEVAPDDLTLQVWLGLLAVGQNRYDDAIVTFRRAMKCSEAEPSEPLAAEALLRLAQLLHHEGYYTASLECYDRLNEWVREHGDAYVERPLLRQVVLRPERLMTPRGELLLELGRADEAADVLDRAFRVDRSRQEVAYLLLRSLLESGRSERAFETLMDIAVEPAHRGQFAELAEMVCRRTGDPELPGRIWNRYRREVEVDGALAVTLARIASDLGAPDEAATLLSDALETMPGNVRAARELVRIRTEAGDVTAALELLVDLLAADVSAAPAVREAVVEIPDAELDEASARRLAEQATEETDDRLHAAHYLAGLAAERAGLDYLAEQQYRAALDARGDFLGAAEGLVDVHIRQNRFDKVERLVEDLHDRDTGYFAEYIAGKLALARGRIHEAVPALRRAHELNSTHLPTLVLLSRAYQSAGQYAQAAAMLRRAIPLSPTDVELYRRLFDIHAALGQHTEAEDVVEQLRRRTGDVLTADVMTAELHLALREYDQARELLDDLKERAPDERQVQLLEVRTTVETADELDEEQFTHAVRVLSRAVIDADGDGMALRLLIQLLEEDRQAEAVAVWQRLHGETRHPRIAALYVEALTETDDEETAIDVLGEILETDPENVWARHRMLHLLVELDRTDEAIAHASDWLERSTDATQREQIRRQLLGMYTEAEEYQAALELIDDWLSEARDADTRRNLRGMKLHLFGLAGEYDRAVDFVAEAIRTVREDLPLKLTLLNILDEGEQYETAQELIDQWLADADDEEAELLRHWRIDMYADAGQFDNAVRAAEQWIEQSPEQVRPRAVIVYALAQADREQQALELVDGWIAELTDEEPDPELVRPDQAEELLRWCKLTAGRLLMFRDLYADALERLDEYAADYGEEAEVLAIRATCLEHLGRDDEALQALERANALDPDDPTVNNNLGYMYAEMGIELNRAERLVRRALAERPDEIAFLDSLAWVFYKQGRFQAAARVFERTFDVAERKEREGRPDAKLHAIIYDHAGDTYWRLGRTDEALEMWLKAVETAEEEARTGPDDEKVLANTPGKIEAVETGERPAVALLGEGVVVDEDEPDEDTQR